MGQYFRFFCLFLFGCAYQSNAQKMPDFDLLSTQQGLSQGMVFDILQSRDGFIWMGTKDGLNRYDGDRFEAFSPDPFDPFAIGGSDIRSLFEDSRGRIWVGMEDKLDVYDPATGRFFHLQKPNAPGSYWRGPFVAETPDGTFWLVHRGNVWKTSIPDGTLERAEKTGNPDVQLTFKPVPLPAPTVSPSEAIAARCLLLTAGKELLIGTNHGLLRLDPLSDKIEQKGPFTGEVHSIMQDGAGRILMHLIEKSDARPDATQVGKVVSWDEKSGIQHGRAISPDARVFSFDPQGFVWMTQDRILKKYRLQRFLNDESPDVQWPFENFLYQHEVFKFHKIFFDRSGMLWACTNGFGVFKINPGKPTFESYLPKTAQRRIFEDPSGNLLTLHDIHLQYNSSRFDRSEPNRSFTYPNPFPWQLATVFDSGGNCWVSDPGEPFLYRTDAQSKARKAFPWKGLGLCLDQKGRLLSVSGEGLSQFDPATEQSRFYPFQAAMRQSTEFSQFFWKDSEGVVWVFGFEGLVKAVPYDADYRFEYFVNNPADRSSLSSNTVLSLADDPLEPARYLWVGTKGGGLNRLDKKTGKFKQYKMEQGLPDNVIYGILAENPSAASGWAGSYIWMSTNRGLCRFDVRAETTKNFTAADGLQDNEFNASSYLKTRDGTMIFGGVRGLTAFHPDSLLFNEHVPQIHLVGLEVNNRKFGIVGQSSVSLSHDQNLLTFHFAALEFTNPAQNQYRYQLVGVDKDWVALGNKNSIQFANLAPGDYTFKVLGSNNDGRWSERPAEIRFVIRPPWWATWWAYLFYFVSIATGLWLFYQNRLRQKMEHQETLRLREMDDFKTRFFTNISHEFRTPLTVILGMSERLLSNQSINNQSTNQPITLIKRNGENLLRLINQILDLAKLESNSLEINYVQGDVLKYLRYIVESLHSLAEAQNVQLRVESEQPKIVMDYDPERLLQIVHNLLSNAIKFTPSGGQVVLRAQILESSNPQVVIEVSDTGVGIAAADLPFLFDRFFQAKNQEHAKSGHTGGTGIGLSLTRELVRTMGGEISVESETGKGAVFTVKLPISNQAKMEDSRIGGIEILNGSAPKPSIPQTFEPPQGQILEPSAPQILIIEDNSDVVEYLAACLQDKYRLAFAFNGQAGIEKALEIVPDLIISDVMMPEKDGLEVCDFLKNDERTSHIPIILLTAKATVEDRITGLRRGADAYLSKPFREDELLVWMEKLIERRQILQARYAKISVENELRPAAAPEPELVLEDAFIQKFRGILEDNFADPDFSTEAICRKIGMSRAQLYRKISALTNRPVNEHISQFRLEKARQMLRVGGMNVSEIAFAVGFNDPKYFSRVFSEAFGAAPSEFLAKR